MKKMLFISNISNKITNFSIPAIEAGHQLGYDFHMAANYAGFKGDYAAYQVTLHHIDLARNPTNWKNIRAYRQMIALLEGEDFDIIHCNTPIGGILGRLCGSRAKVPKVIYTAHGFHFYQGAPLFNRTILRWGEQWMARYTDVLITINHEDYQAARHFKLRRGGKVYYVPGVGVNTRDHQLLNVDRTVLRHSLGLQPDNLVLISMGELKPNKNYAAAIRAIAGTGNPRVHFLVCGKGPELQALALLAKKLGVENQIHLLGFRTDVKELLAVADIFLFASYREGLPRATMEAMASGLPCIVSNIRGNRDLIENGKGGYLRAPDDMGGLAEAINTLAADESKRKTMGQYNLQKIKSFDVENVKIRMKEIYQAELT